MQGSGAGGETGADTSVGAAEAGAAQGGGDGSAEALRSGDGAAQEATENARGQRGHRQLRYIDAGWFSN